MSPTASRTSAVTVAGSIWRKVRPAASNVVPGGRSRRRYSVASGPSGSTSVWWNPCMSEEPTPGGGSSVRNSGTSRPYGARSLHRGDRGHCVTTLDEVAGSILGTAVRRVEDPELLTGRGTFVDNLRLAGALHLAFVRSPMGHAELGAIETAQARGVPGVVGVCTAAALALPAHHGFITITRALPRPPLATDRVR